MDEGWLAYTDRRKNQNKKNDNSLIYGEFDNDINDNDNNDDDDDAREIIIIEMKRQIDGKGEMDGNGNIFKI